MIDDFGCSTQCEVTFDCLSPFGGGGTNLTSGNILLDAVQGEGDVIVQRQGENGDSRVSSLDLWPNPNNGKLKISFNSGIEQDVSMSMSDVLGRVVWVDEVDAVKGFNTKNIDVSHLPSGSYMLTLFDGDGATSKMFVIARL